MQEDGSIYCQPDILFEGLCFINKSTAYIIQFFFFKQEYCIQHIIHPLANYYTATQQSVAMAGTSKDPFRTFELDLWPWPWCKGVCDTPPGDDVYLYEVLLSYLEGIRSHDSNKREIAYVPVHTEGQSYAVICPAFDRCKTKERAAITSLSLDQNSTILPSDKKMYSGPQYLWVPGKKYPHYWATPLDMRPWRRNQPADTKRRSQTTCKKHW